MNRTDRGNELIRLHAAPELLQVVNVWDVVSAKVVAGIPGTKALATASHSIAATFGYPDGEQIPLDLMLDMVGRIVASTDLPVTADLEAGYGNPSETTRRAIGLGVVGMNLEDQMRPLSAAVAAVAEVVSVAAKEGVPFALNARTDAYLRAGDRDRLAVLTDAIERGLGFLEAGATSVFVPGALDEETIAALVGAFGPQKLTVIGIPGALPSPSRLEELGVGRISYGPYTQRLSLTALADATADLMGGGSLPTTIRNLN